MYDPYFDDPSLAELEYENREDACEPYTCHACGEYVSQVQCPACGEDHAGNSEWLADQASWNH